MKQLIALVVLAASMAPGIVCAQVPAGEVAHQVPVIEGVERPDSPNVDEAEGNAEARLPRVQGQPGSAVEQPQVEVPPPPQQPRVQQD